VVGSAALWVRQPYEISEGCGVACDTRTLAYPGNAITMLLEFWICGSEREGGGRDRAFRVRLRARTDGKREGGERAGDLPLVSMSQAFVRLTPLFPLF
jgi:hypothetical protein